MAVTFASTKQIENTLLRTERAGEEREEMERGRSLESKGSSLESSQRARRVSIRSSISTISASDFAAASGGGAAADADEDGGGSAILRFDLILSSSCKGSRKERPMDFVPIYMLLSCLLNKTTVLDSQVCKGH